MYGVLDGTIVWKQELEYFMMPGEGVEQYIDCLVDEDVRIHEEDRTGPPFSMNENEDVFTRLLSVFLY